MSTTGKPMAAASWVVKVSYGLTQKAAPPWQGQRLPDAPEGLWVRKKRINDQRQAGYSGTIRGIGR